MAKVLGFTINIQGTEAAIQNATDLQLAIKEINKRLKETSDASEYEKLEKQLIDLKARQKVVNEEIRETIKRRTEELTATSESAGAYRKLSSQLTETRKKYKDLAAAGQENSIEAKQFLTEITALDSRLKGIDASVGQFQRSVGDYTNSILKAIPGLGAFSDGIENIGKATGRVGKAIATSFFIFEIINQLAAGVQAISEFSEQFRQLQGDIQNLTGETGQALIDNTAIVKALGDTYGQTTDEITNAANALSKEFNVSLEDSLFAIEAGFRKGANAQGDFLDQLREYPTQFREAGFELDQFIALSIRASQEGIYSDKGLDAVKEFGLRIREQTKATKAALNNAFGEEFTQELFLNLNSGAIDTTQALAKVATGLRDVDLTAEQTQTVIADVFGGAGEDAGLRYLQLLADIDDETGNVRESTNEYQSQQEELFEANLRLSDAQAEIANQLGNTGAEFTLLKTKAKTFLLEIAADLLKFFDELPATIAGVSAAIGQFVDNFKAGFGLFGETGSIADAYKDAYLTGIKKIEKDNEIAAANKAVSEKFAKQLSGNKAAKTASDKRIKEIERQQEAEQKALEKAEQARVKGLEKEQSDTAKQLQAITKLRNETIRVALGAGNELISGSIVQVEDGFRIFSGTLSDRSADILKRLKENTAKGNQDAGSFISSIFGTDDPQELATGAEDFLSNSILPVVSAFRERAAAQATEAIDAQITAQEEGIAELNEQIANSSGIQKEILENKLAEEQKVLDASNAEKEKLQDELAKKEKRLNIVQSIIQTALSVSRALANPPGFPFSLPQAIIAGIQGAAQTAIIAAQPLAMGGLITGRRVTDQQNISTRSNGDNVLATVRRGEVVLNNRQQNALGGAATFRAIGVPGFAAGGVISAPISAPTLPQAAQSGSNELLALVKGLDKKTDAINGRIDRIQTYVVSEDIAADLSEGERIRTQATFE